MNIPHIKGMIEIPHDVDTGSIEVFRFQTRFKNWCGEVIASLLIYIAAHAAGPKDTERPPISGYVLIPFSNSKERQIK